MQQDDLRARRELVDREICRSYQRRLLHELRNFNINDANPSFNVGQAIDACLDHVMIFKFVFLKLGI